MRKNYIFTDKSYSERSIFSAVIGAISVISEAVAVYYSFLGGGKPELRLGMVLFLSMLYALAGELCGILSRMEKDRFYLFADLGIALNALGLIGVGVILFL